MAGLGVSLKEGHFISMGPLAGLAEDRFSNAMMSLSLIGYLDSCVPKTLVLLGIVAILKLRMEITSGAFLHGMWKK